MFIASNGRRRSVVPALALALLVAILQPRAALGQITAQVPADAKSVWNKGILPISPESYYHAIECGKQGGQNPPCVFWDTGLCKNEDFTLAMYTPYKAVAYEAWRLVRTGSAAPTPNYQEAQRTRVTVGVTPVRGSKNPIAALVVRRGGKALKPATQSVDPADSRFTFDYPAFAATGDITIDIVGKARTISCNVPQSVLARFR
jgi:hypothetical protein